MKHREHRLLTLARLHHWLSGLNFLIYEMGTMKYRPRVVVKICELVDLRCEREYISCPPRLHDH